MTSNDLKLSLVEKLILLALDDEKGNFVSDSMVFGYCVAGAVLFELSTKERIQIIQNKVKVVNREKLNDEVLDHCLDLISQSKKERTAKYWIEKVGNKERTLRKQALKKLISQGILTEKENKILWVFTSKKYPTKNARPENKIRKRLHEILNYSKAEVDEIMMISLVDACGLNKEVFGKEVAKKKKAEIKKIIKDYPFADSTGKLIKEIHDTIIAVLVILMTTTTIASTSS